MPIPPFNCLTTPPPLLPLFDANVISIPEIDMAVDSDANGEKLGDDDAAKA